MADATDPAGELERIEAALAAQEALRGVLPAEQVETMIAALRDRRTVTVARLAGSCAIAQDGGVAAGAGGVAIGRDLHGNLTRPSPIARVRNRCGRRTCKILCSKSSLQGEELPTLEVGIALEHAVNGMEQLAHHGDGGLHLLFAL
ncbi:MAG TPA: hypothetical protein VGG06_20310, partial [Thermoanaerobaculia bacterium]